MTAPDFAHWLSSLPTRHSKAQADKILINRLLEIKGIAREVLCYACHRDDHHIWVSEDRRAPNWIKELKRAGLVKLTNASFRSAHYEIHPIAWAFIRRRPNKFVCKIDWEDPPWTEDFGDEGRVNKMIDDAA
jgi:hypothetical protein